MAQILRPRRRRSALGRGRCVRHTVRIVRPRALLLAFGPALAAVLLAAAAPAGAEGACPNETLRSELHSGQLPDCRAYEMVTPAYTESALLTELFAVSPDGSRVLGGSLGTFAGAEANELNNTTIRAEAYLLSRTPAGWAPLALGPPLSRYRGGGGFLDASADLGSSLWVMGTVAQPENTHDLYLQQPHGTFRKIGPSTPQPGDLQRTFHYFGASEELSRVLFTTFEGPGSRWPFDGTVSGGTLYEYAGVEQAGEVREPLLVGVEGGRGSAALISRCGTRLGSTSVDPSDKEGAFGSGFGSVYNAISADGARVFFTAIGADHKACGSPQPPVDELFVREATPPPAQSRSPEMSTHPLSCPPAPLSPCADANFEAASHDGSKVFFTSTAKLLEGAGEDNTSGDSAQNCSATTEAGGCNLYQVELAGSGASLTQRLTLVSAGSADPEVQGVARVSEDGSHAYFVAKGKLTEAPNRLGSRAVAGENNLYVYAEGHVSFIATLSPGDSADWGHSDSRLVITSGEGRFLVFLSEADLLNEGISPGKNQVFQYDAATGALVRASIGQEGYNDNGRNPAVGSNIRNGLPNSYGSAADSPTLAAGFQAPTSGVVFFQSPDALTPQALNDQRGFQGASMANVYEYRAGHVYLLSDGRDTSVIGGASGVSLAGSDPIGDVFFFTSEPLIPADGNTQQDLFDARVEGGFPTPPSAPDCREACQGALAAAPALAQPGSATQVVEAETSTATSAPATIKPKPNAKPKKCKRGARLKHGRCVKRKAKRSNRGRRGK
jgi:hypothetical protein